MTLTSDCGSTKCDWLANGAIVSTPGINAAIMDESVIDSIIRSHLLPQIDAAAIREIRYYGAGCIGGEANEKVRRALSRNFVNAARIEVASDMLAAARALCGSKEGIACILGTGSNSCYFDGNKIADRVPPLGFILGDEGSGAAIGKRFVGDVLKRVMPARVRELFFEQTSLSEAEIIQRVYREPAANRFLASFSPLVHSMRGVPEVKAMLIDEFSRFFCRNVMRYSRCHELPIGFVGSVAFFYQEELAQAARGLDLNLAKIIKSPLTAV